MIPSLYKWIAIAVIAAGAIGGAYFYGRGDGYNKAAVEYQVRIDNLKELDRLKNEAITAINKAWQANLDAVTEGLQKLADDRAAEADELQKKVDDYEKSLPSGDCLLDQHDVDSLR